MEVLLGFIESKYNKYRPSIQIVNQSEIKPVTDKGEPEKNIISGMWIGGYQFNRFLGNCYEFLGELSKLSGMQQLIHAYYLNNGGINSEDCANRIKKLIGE